MNVKRLILFIIIIIVQSYILNATEVKLIFKNSNFVFTNFLSFKIESDRKVFFDSIKFQRNNDKYIKYKYNLFDVQSFINIPLNELKDGFYNVTITIRTNKYNLLDKRTTVLFLHSSPNKISENEFATLCFNLFIDDNRWLIMNSRFSKWIENFFNIAVKKGYNHPVINLFLTDYYLHRGDHIESIKSFNKTIYFFYNSTKYSDYYRNSIVYKLLNFKKTITTIDGKSKIKYFRKWIMDKICSFIIYYNYIMTSESKGYENVLSDFLNTIDSIFSNKKLDVNFKSLILESSNSSWTLSSLLNFYKNIFVLNVKIKNINKSLAILKKIMKIFDSKDKNNIKLSIFSADRTIYYSWRAYIEYLRGNKETMKKFLMISKETKMVPFLKAHLTYDKGDYDKSVLLLKKCLSGDNIMDFAALNPNPQLSFEGEIYNLMGLCYFNKGYYQIALDKFLSAVSAPDAIPAYKENLAVCYEKLGEKQKAEKILKDLSGIPDLFLKAYFDSLKQKIKYKPLKDVPIMWVLPFDNRGGIYKRAGIGEYLQDIMMAQLYQTKKFRIVERDKIQEIIKEKKLSVSKFGDKKYLKDKRKIITADYIITGNFAEFKDEYNLIIRMISVKTGEIVKVKEKKKKKFKDIREYLAKFVEQR